MALFLDRLCINGVKSIEHECDVRFYRQGKVKAVYGSNGSGKTAFMLGAFLLKQLLIEPDLLLAHKDAVGDWINCNTHRASLRASFEASRGTKTQKYRYAITVVKKDGSLRIENESLELLKRGNDATFVFEVKEGLLSINESFFPKEAASLLQQKTINLLSRSSFCSLFLSLLDENRPLLSKVTPLMNLVGLGFDLQVCLKGEDIPMEPYSLEEQKEIDPRIQSRLRELYGSNRNKELDFIPSSSLESYRIDSENLCAFIRLFKPDLDHIDVDAREVETGIVGVERIFDYGNGKRIASYMESTGIKSLCRLFAFLSLTLRGKIVFIDEMDANLDGVFLSSLIEYIQDFAPGQLCFTSHNTHLMETLNRTKGGIAFLSSTLGVTHWVKNGNYQPESQWNKGFVPGFAKNFEPLDFYHCMPPAAYRE